MKILVVGSGAREHALLWRLAQSPNTILYALPGNPGAAQIATCLPPSGGTSPTDILSAAQSLEIDLTVVGPEAPLVAGIVNLFRANAMPIIGPSAENAQLEGSKVYAKHFFKQHSIPTADFQTVTTYTEAHAALNRFGYPVVVKADGLAAGKGVIIAQDRAQAETAYEQLGPNVVIEELLTGPEVSFIALCDGRDVTPLVPARDHKRIFDNDQGPNTGGMGAYCDPHLLTDYESVQILETIIWPTVEATRFTGFLYAGLMMTPDGPKLLEYNVRLGDPETQPLMCQLNTDLAELLMSAAMGKMGIPKISWKPGASVAVVIASEGYPGEPKTGDKIGGIEDAQALGAVVFQGGTSRTPNGLETAGGRVLSVTATGPTIAEAVKQSYAAVSQIHFRGMQFRRDIGRRSSNRI